MFETVSPPPRPVIRLDYPLLSPQKLMALAGPVAALLLAAACGFWIGRFSSLAPGVAPEETGMTQRSLQPPTVNKRGPQQVAAPADVGNMLLAYASTSPRAASEPGPRIVDFRTRLLDARSGQLSYTFAAESNGTPYQGQLSFDIAGLRNGRMEMLRAPSAEAAVVVPERLKLSFNRYVRTEGAVLLPQGFTPFFVGASLPSAGAGELKKLACPS